MPSSQGPCGTSPLVWWIQLRQECGATEKVGQGNGLQKVSFFSIMGGGKDVVHRKKR